MARMRHYNPDTKQWEYSDTGDDANGPILTEEDKQEMVNAVLAALPVAEGGSY